MRERTDLTEWFAQNRHRLKHNGLYLDGREPGRPDPSGFDSASLRLLICRLSPYEDVLSSISHRMLFWAAQQVPGVYVDLAFFPPPGDAELLKKENIPFWLASGCKRPPADFDVLAISISVVQEAVNLPTALQSSGLTLGFQERIADPDHPWILLGGHAAGSVPFIHGDIKAGDSAPHNGLVDLVCFGDGILWIQEFLSRLKTSRENVIPKQQFLISAARELPGTYAPSLYRHEYQDGRLSRLSGTDPEVPQPVQYRIEPSAAWAGKYDGSFIPFSEEETEETLLLASGCPYRCRFCQTGWTGKASPGLDATQARLAALRLKAATAASDLNLLTPDACSASSLREVIGSLLDIFERVSIKSLAVTSLARRGDLLPLIRQIEKREFTFGLEGISERLRNYLGKPAAAAVLVRIISDLISAGLRQLKLFFIATGMETDDDIAEFIDLLGKIRSVMPRGRIIASFTPLFNAPFTPLQYGEVRTINTILSRRLAEAVKQAECEFRWSASIEEMRAINLLCRAGRQATPILVDMALHGFKYYDELPTGFLPELEKRLRDSEIDVESLCRQREQAEILPWDDLEAGNRKADLWRAFHKARNDLEQLAPRAAPAPSPQRAHESPQKRKEILHRGAWVQIPQHAQHHPDITIARGLLRTMFSQHPDLALSYRGQLELIHPKGTIGLALLKAGFDRPVISGDWFDIHIDESQLIFSIELPTSPNPDRLIKALAQKRIPYQTVRSGTDRWNIVASGYRRRTGLWAFRNTPDLNPLVIGGRTIPDFFDPSIVLGGLVQGVFLITENKCPLCGDRIWNPLRDNSPGSTPACLGCILRKT